MALDLKGSVLIRAEASMMNWVIRRAKNVRTFCCSAGGGSLIWWWRDLSLTEVRSGWHGPPAGATSRLHLAVGAVRWPVVFGEGLELQRVEGILPTADVLHSVLSAAALAGETGGGGGQSQLWLAACWQSHLIDVWCCDSKIGQQESRDIIRRNLVSKKRADYGCSSQELPAESSRDIVRQRRKIKFAK